MGKKRRGVYMRSGAKRDICCPTPYHRCFKNPICWASAFAHERKFTALNMYQVRPLVAYSIGLRVELVVLLSPVRQFRPYRLVVSGPLLLLVSLWRAVCVPFLVRQPMAWRTWSCFCDNPWRSTTGQPMEYFILYGNPWRSAMRQPAACRTISYAATLGVPKFVSPWRLLFMWHPVAFRNTSSCSVAYFYFMRQPAAFRNTPACGVTYLYYWATCGVPQNVSVWRGALGRAHAASRGVPNDGSVWRDVLYLMRQLVTFRNPSVCRMAYFIFFGKLWLRAIRQPVVWRILCCAATRSVHLLMFAFWVKSLGITHESGPPVDCS